MQCHRQPIILRSSHDLGGYISPQAYSGVGKRRQIATPITQSVRGVHNRSIRLRLSSFYAVYIYVVNCLWGDFYENFCNFERKKNVLAGRLGPPNLVVG